MSWVLMEERKLKIMREWGTYSKPCGHGSKKTGSRVQKVGRGDRHGKVHCKCPGTQCKGMWHLIIC